MNQIMECKDMNREEAMELCRQEYEKEREHAAARELVRDGIFGIAISRYADLEEVNRLFVLSGFGIRCSDAVLSLKEYELSDKDSKVAIGELKQEERAELAPLFEKLQKHLSVSPCFFPRQEGQAGVAKQLLDEIFYPLYPFLYEKD